MFQYIFFVFLRRKWFFIALAVMFLVASLPSPPQMNEKGTAVIGLTLMAVILFISGAIPLPATALLIAFFQVLLNISRPEQVARTFTGDSLFFIMGILLISNILIQQKLDRKIAVVLIRLTGFRISRLTAGIMLFSALLAAFIGQHTAGAILFPVVITLISGISRDMNKRDNIAKLLLFSLAYSSMVGGMATPSGGARNPLMIEYLWRISDIRVDYFEWMLLALPIMLLLLPFLYFSLRMIFKCDAKDLLLDGETVKILSGEGKKEKMSGSSKHTIAIFLLILFFWIFFSKTLGMGMIALMGVMLFLITVPIDWSEISSKTNWGIILIYASTLSLGLAMRNTGVTTWLAEGITNFFYNLNIDQAPFILSFVCIVAALLSNILSHGPSVAVSGPIFIKLAEIYHYNVIVVGVINALAASFGFLTVIAAPVNSLIFASGYVRTSDFIKAGLICTIICIAVMVLLATFYWKILGYAL